MPMSSNIRRENQTAGTTPLYEAEGGALHTPASESDATPRLFETGVNEDARKEMLRRYPAQGSTAIALPPPLPPYILQNNTGSETVYTFAVPDSVRPKSWPAMVAIGGDHGNGPREVAQRAWAMYGYLLYLMHTERMATAPAPDTGLREAIAAYRASPQYLALTPAAREQMEMSLHEIMLWAELNGHPPLTSLAPDHIHAFLLSHGGAGHRAELHSALDVLFNKGQEMGMVNFNAAASIPAIDADWDDRAAAAPIPYPVHVFAEKAAWHPPVEPV